MATVTSPAQPTHSHTSVASDHIDKEPRLTHAQTNITISPELFEKLYLAPKVPHANERVTQYANAVPLGFLGFVISTFSFAMILMGWGGASGLQSIAGIFFFTGPLLLTLSCIFLWIQAQFFPMMVTGLFSVFWLSFGLLQLPSAGIAASFPATGNAAEGAASKELNAGLALFCIVWGFAMATFGIFTIRMNLVFVGIFWLAATATWLLSAAYWEVSKANFGKAMKLQKAGGALNFVVAILGWYMLIVIMMAEMRWTVNLPVGDLTHYWQKTDIEIAAMENEKKD